MTTAEKVIATAYTGVFFISSKDLYKFYRYIENKLGRSVNTHELSEDKIWEEIKELSREDFIKICKGENCEEALN